MSCGISNNAIIPPFWNLGQREKSIVIIVFCFKFWYFFYYEFLHYFDFLNILNIDFLNILITQFFGIP